MPRITLCLLLTSVSIHFISISVKLALRFLGASFIAMLTNSMGRHFVLIYQGDDWVAYNDVTKTSLCLVEFPSTRYERNHTYELLRSLCKLDLSIYS